MNYFDLFGYHLLNQWAGHIPMMDKLMAFIAQYALEVYAILFLIAWFTIAKVDSKRRHGLVVMGVSGILALIINLIIAHIWYRPRPFVTLAPGTFTKLIPHSPDASFPSDHVTGSFGFAAGSWGKSSKWVSRSFTIFAILVAIARVYTGVHWPTDVLGAALVGILSAKVVWKVNFLLIPLTRLGLRLCRFGQYHKFLLPEQ